MSRLFPSALVALILGMLLAGNASATSYYIAANGSDSSNGTSETTPWLHAPGMNGCSSVCASSSPLPGDQFIFRGGDTWLTTSGVWVWSWSGGSGNAIYIGGGDQTWFNSGACGASYCRPIVSEGGTVSKAFETASGVKWVHLDNLEWKGMFSNLSNPNSGQIDYIDLSRNTNISDANMEISNNYLHDGNVAHDGAHNAHFILGSLGSADASSSLHDNVLDNSDRCTPPGPCTIDLFEGAPHIIYRNYFGYASCGIVTDWPLLLYNNTIEWIVLSPDNGVDHENAMESNGDTNFLLFNNVVRHVYNAGIVDFQMAPVNSTSYAFNNVLPDMDGGNMQQCYEGSPANNHCSWFNNTAEAGPDSGNPSGMCGRNTGSNTTSSVTNQHCITTATGNSWWSGTASFTTNLSQTKAAANAEGYSNAQIYAFSPTAANGSTVGAGTNMSSTCSTITAINAAAGAACMQDTSYGAAYDVSTHTITGAGRLSTNARPASGAWDVGAYQFGAGDPPPNAPTGLSAVVQ